MTLIESAKQALEALEDPWNAGPEGVANAITALRTAIAEAESVEPVACQYAIDVAMPEHRCVGKCQYTTPPTPQRQPLTEAEVFKAIRHLYRDDQACRMAIEHSMDEYRAIEAAHGIKEKNT